MRVIELRDERSGLDAFLVIDHELFDVSVGGTRMLPDVDRREIARLARAMTWKLAACRVPYAGAKAGIRFAGGNRDEVLAAYKRALEPYRDVFLNGPDMGTSPADFLEDGDGPVPLSAQSYEGLGMDDVATGRGVKAAAEAALAQLGRTLEGATVAVEGFGKVGAGTARACSRAGALVVGISTVNGLLSDPEGLDVDELLELRSREGDGLVEHGSRPVRPREELFELDCDVLVPGARPDSISADVAHRVRCAVVAPGANIPYGPGALEVLHRRGVLAIPDFLANSGGVHLYEILDQSLDPETALAAIDAAVYEEVARAVGAAEERGLTPSAAAFENARDYLAEATAAPPDVLDDLFVAAGPSLPPREGRC